MISLIPWWVKAAAVGALVLVVYGAGWKTRDAFCDAAAAKTALAAEQQIAADLRRQLTTYQQAAADDNLRALEDQQEINKLKEASDEVETRIVDGACLTGADTGELRAVWPEAER
ncbi:MAG: hypothetical protein GEV06_16565 [Luteitalea sp.]|nr:hypothetical protein [Luteitalea sp.]